MSNPIYIQDYSPRTFIVRGETRDYKTSLRTIGGKWNPMLTDKETGLKFGAWIFFSEKRAEIEEWIKDCRPDSLNPLPNEVQTQYKPVESQNSKLDKIYKMLEAICALHNIKIE